MEFDANKIISFVKDNFNNISIDISIILGSGLGDFAGQLTKEKSIKTSEIPNYPISTVVGHAGEIILCKYEQKNILLFKGRIHLYEGYNISKIILPTQIAIGMNSNYLIITNAAGGIADGMQPGDLMLITDIFFPHYKSKFTSLGGHIRNLNKLPKELMEIAIKVSQRENIELKNGTYAFSLGPSYETPAEIQFLKKAGCDAVGMSTVPEIIFSQNSNMKTIGISCITNLAAGISKTKLTHDEVTETANQAKSKFSVLLKEIIKELP
ncbi:MAG: purine-nucleoside phosphorylase [Ignavibacteria bacterium]|nr:purine-nucleoside phosphorylase [Ignavibacteria bacterium]